MPEPIDLNPYRDLLDALNCGAAIVSRAGEVVVVNDRLGAMMLRPRHELEGLPLRSLYSSPHDRDALVTAHADFDIPTEGEFHVPLPNGGRLPVIASARPLGTTPPLGDYRLVTLIDISRQKAVERTLQEQYQVIAELSNTILDQAMNLRDHADVLEQRVRSRTADLREANLDTIYMLAIASEAKDEDTGRHVRRIQHLARKLALELDFSDGEADAIGYSSVLHDVGKMHVPDHILKKPGPLTDDERSLIQQHTLAGERILGANPFFARARLIARSHHENFDGTGYPDRLGGQDIPVEARIVHVADVFDALTHPRVYKHAWDVGDAIAVLHEGAGRMFDPQVIEAFDRLCGKNAHLPEPTLNGH